VPITALLIEILKEIIITKIDKNKYSNTIKKA
jgi:hypothetical protein